MKYEHITFSRCVRSRFFNVFSPHVRESGIRNPANFCCWNPESRDWNPESTMVWNPESRRLESGIQRVEIQNPDAGIRNLVAGIRNPGPSWILLHGASLLHNTANGTSIRVTCYILMALQLFINDTKDRRNKTLKFVSVRDIRVDFFRDLQFLSNFDKRVNGRFIVIWASKV